MSSGNEEQELVIEVVTHSGNSNVGLWNIAATVEAKNRDVLADRL